MFILSKIDDAVITFNTSLLPENEIQALFEKQTAKGLTVEVADEKSLAGSFLTMKDFCGVYNLAGTLDEKLGKAPLKFKSKDAAAARVFPLLQKVASIVHPAKPKRTKGVTPVTEKPAPKTRKTKGISLAAAATAYPCRAGTKQAALIDALAMPDGAELKHLRVATGGKWTDSAIKSGLYWDVNHVKGYGIRTEMKDDAPVYHLVLPEGMEKPLAHTPKKTQGE